MGDLITKELLESSTNEELLEVFNKIEEHLKYLKENILVEEEETTEKEEKKNE